MECRGWHMPDGCSFLAPCAVTRCACLPAGATDVVIAEAEAGLVVGSRLARGLGVPDRAVRGLAGVMRTEMTGFAAELAARLTADSGATQLATVFKFDQSKSPALTDDTIVADEPLPGAHRS
jgi:hypothetical protein